MKFTPPERIDIAIQSRGDLFRTGEEHAVCIVHDDECPEVDGRHRCRCLPSIIVRGARGHFSIGSEGEVTPLS